MTDPGDAARLLRALRKLRPVICARPGCGKAFVSAYRTKYCSAGCARYVLTKEYRDRIREKYSSWYAFLMGSRKPRPPRPRRRPR